MKLCRALGLELIGALLFALALPAVPALAQDKYPERSIRLIVPFAPGGGVDIVARIFAQKMGPLLGQNMIVDNKGGAGGTIGAAEVAHAKPDGYTLLLGTSTTQAISPLMMDAVPYDPIKDFAPIAVIGIIPSVIAVHPSVPAKTLRELIARVKASPGKYSYGSTEGSNNLAGELFKKQAGGLDIVYVPYKSGGQSIQAGLGGEVPIIIAAVSASTPYHPGKLRILAVLSDGRSGAAPDIPTGAEAGVPGIIASIINVLCAPRGTPKPIIDRLYQATHKLTTDRSFQNDLEKLGIDPVTDSNPEKAGRSILDELNRWAPIIKARGIKAN